MREMIMQQNESLLERMDLLTEEKRASVNDRRQLLDRTAQVLEQVEDAETRIGAKTSLEAEIQRFEANPQTSELERLQRSNGALAQQVLGEEAETPLAGSLELLEGEAETPGQDLRSEVG